MVFEIGKCYRHTTGLQMHVIGEVETMARGKGLLAEQYGIGDELTQVGTLPENAVNWSEITIEEWENNFS